MRPEWYDLISYSLSNLIKKENRSLMTNSYVDIKKFINNSWEKDEGNHYSVGGFVMFNKRVGVFYHNIKHDA
jgi:hypothetical protein